MPARLARLVVRCSAWLAPGDSRARWREEWLAEIDATAEGRTVPLSAGRRARPRLLLRALGAPIDALWLRCRDLGAGLRTGWPADLRDAVRSLGRTPVQTLAMVLCLGLGSLLAVVGGGVLNAMAGGALPGIRNRAQLVRLVVERTAEPRPDGLIGAEHRALPDVIPGLAGWGAEYGSKPTAVEVAGESRVVRASFVSGTYFAVLGTTPVLGRLIQPADDRLEAPPVVVIGHAFWQRHLGGRVDALGRLLRFGTGTYTVIGVAPPAFTGVLGGDFQRPASERGELWLPMAQTAAVGLGVGHESGTGPEIIGRLEPAMSRDTAESQGQAVVNPLNAAREASAYSGGRDTIAAIRLLPFRMSIVDDDEAAAMAALLAVLAGVPLIVLGIGCANVAGIQLARAIGRTHELAVRTALGASRLRVARLLALETALAAVAAAVVAWIVGRVLLQSSGTVLPIAPVADGRLLLVAAALPIAITLAAGLLPAWRATGCDVLAGLRANARAGRAPSARLRRVVVAAQITLSVALLVTAAALTSGLGNIAETVGPLHNDVLTAEIAFANLGFDEDLQRQARATIVSRVRGLPGVHSIALSPSRLFRSSGGDGTCWPGTGPRPNDVARWTLTRIVTPEFFDILRIPLRAGRSFQSRDRADVVIINEAFLRRLPNPAAPLGVQVSYGRNSVATVVGVVADSYERYPNGVGEPRCYVPWDDTRAGAFAMFARTDRAGDVAPIIRSILREVDPRLAPAEIGTVADIARTYYRGPLAIANGLSVAGAIAIALAAIGLFGILSYGAAQRTHEFGIRLALGGRPSDLRRALISESFAVVAIGAAAGLVIAGGPMLWLMSQGLNTISLADPRVWATVISLLLLVSVGAVARPLRFVSRLSPMTALRDV